ncbi:MAG TPA: SRPBCC domain-containing protein [Thermoanaerobaculia bacterium]|nr:SRPBCC domain-containing protein [Thermoanaerobaculia bacterium]
MELKFTVHTKIQKPAAEVFDAVRDPAKLSKYFATGGASGPLDEGTQPTWRWADHPGITGVVEVKKVIPNQLIVFEWEASEGGYNTSVEMKFEPLNDRETLVSITESGFKDTPKGRESSYGNCHGWTQMICSLKAWLEYGINLRKGAY